MAGTCSRFRALLLAATAAIALPAAARPLWDRSWIEVRSPHFFVLSSAGERATRAVAADLETFRAAVQQLLRVRVEERVPTVVFLAPEGASDFGIRHGRLGWFRPEMRQNTALVGSGEGGLSTTFLLFHEYTHFLVHNQPVDVVYPPWFEEGLAEVLSTMRFEKERALVGEPLRARREILELATWLPFDQVLQTRGESSLGNRDREMFYAQSWALVHFLLLGLEGELLERMGAYAKAVEAGTADGAAFESAFGTPPSALRRSLRTHLKQEAQALALERAAPGALAVRPVPRDEIAARLGRLAVTGRDLDLAQSAFQAALETNPKSGAALVGVAKVRELSGRPDEAEPLYQRAIELEPDDPYHRLDYAEFLFERARAAQGVPTHARQRIAAARREFARSHALDPSLPETLAMNGATYLGDADGTEKAIASLEAAHALLPAQPQIKFLLARAYEKARREEEARQLFRSLLAWRHAERCPETEALLRELEARRDSATGSL
jgi:tetratricopeptide (TPR) repeat protein